VGEKIVHIRAGDEAKAIINTETPAARKKKERKRTTAGTEG